MRVHRHPADGIRDGILGWSFRAAVIVPGMVMVRHLASLETYTPYRYISIMRRQAKATSLKRLKRIEGQVRGLARMVEGDRYCIDIVTQIGAVRAALRKVEEEVLRDHVAHCVDGAIASGNRSQQRRKIAELMDVFGRADR
jgi:DNA-binding FrmR family transcriptional regulator